MMMMTSMLNDDDDGGGKDDDDGVPCVHDDFEDNDAREEKGGVILFQVGWVLVDVCPLLACWLLFAMCFIQYNRCGTFYTGWGRGCQFAGKTGVELGL